MNIVKLPILWTIVVDCIAWTIIHPSVAYLATRFPPAILDHNLWLYRTRPWERGGALYDDLFHVRKWKSRLPDAGRIFGNAFTKERIRYTDQGYLRTWVRETCRAELCHWIAILPSLLFFLWNPIHLGVIMVIYAMAFNAVPIVVQRYNRPRLLAIIQKQEKLTDS
jgi:glycosyl-4,4'-diaponeurosporenoate acyltransferase